jgi:hypothetical protein
MSLEDIFLQLTAAEKRDQEEKKDLEKEGVTK